MSLEIHKFYRLTCDCQFKNCIGYHDLGYIDTKDIIPLYKEVGWLILSGGLYGKWACPICKESLQ